MTSSQAGRRSSVSALNTSSGARGCESSRYVPGLQQPAASLAQFAANDDTLTTVCGGKAWFGYLTCPLQQAFSSHMLVAAVFQGNRTEGSSVASMAPWTGLEAECPDPRTRFTFSGRRHQWHVAPDLITASLRHARGIPNGGKCPARSLAPAAILILPLCTSHTAPGLGGVVIDSTPKGAMALCARSEVLAW